MIKIVVGTDSFVSTLNRNIKKVDSELSHALNRLMFDTADVVRKYTPTRKYRLRTSIKHYVYNLSGLKRGALEKVYTRVPYAWPIEFGRRPGIIAARRRKVLRFIVGGKLVFTPRVRHPGHHAFAMFTKGAIFLKNNVEKYLRGALS